MSKEKELEYKLDEILLNQLVIFKMISKLEDKNNGIQRSPTFKSLKERLKKERQKASESIHKNTKTDFY